jgi:2-polyprenyl-3-methyl-5-hydroxy-6-metoxy-1,4-benzoquinol methylase
MQSRNGSRSRNSHVCPWWLAYTFDNPLRSLFQEPQKMLAPYVKQGMRVMDVGCGMGFFSIGMAKLVGDKGKVFSVDLQPKMLEVTEKRAKRAGVAEQIFLHRCDPDILGINEKVDFILTFWMVHEVKDQRDFFSQLQSNLNGGGMILTAEPKMHVTAEDFQKTLAIAQSVGLQLCGQPLIRFSRTALLKID